MHRPLTSRFREAAVAVLCFPASFTRLWVSLIAVVVTLHACGHGTSTRQLSQAAAPNTASPRTSRCEAWEEKIDRAHTLGLTLIGRGRSMPERYENAVNVLQAADALSSPCTAGEIDNDDIVRLIETKQLLFAALFSDLRLVEAKRVANETLSYLPSSLEPNHANDVVLSGHFAQAFALYGTDATWGAYHNGIALGARGDFRSARNLLNLSAKPDDRDSLYIYGLSYLANGERCKALVQFWEALSTFSASFPHPGVTDRSSIASLRIIDTLFLRPNDSRATKEVESCLSSERAWSKWIPGLRNDPDVWRYIDSDIPAKDRPIVYDELAVLPEYARRNVVFYEKGRIYSNHLRMLKEAKFQESVRPEVGGRGSTSKVMPKSECDAPESTVPLNAECTFAMPVLLPAGRGCSARAKYSVSFDPTLPPRLISPQGMLSVTEDDFTFTRTRKGSIRAYLIAAPDTTLGRSNCTSRPTVVYTYIFKD